MSTSQRKCLVFTIDEKLQYLQQLKNGQSLNDIAQNIGVHVTTIRRWIRDEKKLEQFKNSKFGRRTVKRLRDAANPLLEEAMSIWFDECTRQSTPLTGPLIKQKALELNEKLGGSKKFVASEGWLNRWKNRNCIKSYVTCGEKLYADRAAADDFKKQFDSLLEIENLHPCQIFNADEIGLNYKILPNKTSALQSNRGAFGLKHYEDRLTVMACANADGSYQLPLVVIGASERSHVLKNHQDSRSVMYTYQKNAWMNACIFEKWFITEFVPCVSKFLLSKNLPTKALLLVDNAACHPKDLGLRDIKVMFFPPNTTSLIQPLDQGIVETLKKNYRHLFLSSILAAQESGVTLQAHIENITVKNAIAWIAKAWHDVLPITISKCWNPLISQHVSPQQEMDTAGQLSLLTYALSYTLNADFSIDDVRDWITNSDNIDSPTLTDDEIVSKVQPPENHDIDDKEYNSSTGNIFDGHISAGVDDQDLDYFDLPSRSSQLLRNDVNDNLTPANFKKNIISSLQSGSQAKIEAELKMNPEILSPASAVKCIDSVIEFFELHGSLKPQEMSLLWNIRHKAACLNYETI